MWSELTDFLEQLPYVADLVSATHDALPVDEEAVSSYNPVLDYLLQ
jgi:hypothetical protein